MQILSTFLLRNGCKGHLHPPEISEPKKLKCFTGKYTRYRHHEISSSIHGRIYRGCQRYHRDPEVTKNSDIPDFAFKFRDLDHSRTWPPKKIPKNLGSFFNETGNFQKKRDVGKLLSHLQSVQGKVSGPLNPSMTLVEFRPKVEFPLRKFYLVLGAFLGHALEP